MLHACYHGADRFLDSEPASQLARLPVCHPEGWSHCFSNPQGCFSVSSSTVPSFLFSLLSSVSLMLSLPSLNRKKKTCQFRKGKTKEKIIRQNVLDGNTSPFSHQASFLQQLQCVFLRPLSRCWGAAFCPGIFLPVSLFCPARHTVILINVLGPTSGRCVPLKVNCWCLPLFSAIDADWSPPRSHTSSRSFTSRTKCTQAWTCCMVINNVDRPVEEGYLSSEAIRE